MALSCPNYEVGEEDDAVNRGVDTLKCCVARPDPHRSDRQRRERIEPRNGAQEYIAPGLQPGVRGARRESLSPGLHPGLLIATPPMGAEHARAYGARPSLDKPAAYRARARHVAPPQVAIPHEQAKWGRP